MGNHFHLVILATAAPPTPAAAVRRYAAFHHAKCFITPASPQGERLAAHVELNGVRMELARVIVGEACGTTEQIETARNAASAKPAPLLTLHRRVRHWSDGLIIGTKLFIRTNLSTVLSPERLACHQYPPAVRFARGTTAPPLCAWRRLRLAAD